TNAEPEDMGGEASWRARLSQTRLVLDVILVGVDGPHSLRVLRQIVCAKPKELLSGWRVLTSRGSGRQHERGEDGSQPLGRSDSHGPTLPQDDARGFLDTLTFYILICRQSQYAA